MPADPLVRFRHALARAFSRQQHEASSIATPTGLVTGGDPSRLCGSSTSTQARRGTGWSSVTTSSAGRWRPGPHGGRRLRVLLASLRAAADREGDLLRSRRWRPHLLLGEGALVPARDQCSARPQHAGVHGTALPPACRRLPRPTPSSSPRRRSSRSCLPSVGRAGSGEAHLRGSGHLATHPPGTRWAVSPASAHCPDELVRDPSISSRRRRRVGAPGGAPPPGVTRDVALEAEHHPERREPRCTRRVSPGHHPRRSGRRPPARLQRRVRRDARRRRTPWRRSSRRPAILAGEDVGFVDRGPWLGGGAPSGSGRRPRERTFVGPVAKARCSGNAAGVRRLLRRLPPEPALPVRDLAEQGLRLHGRGAARHPRRVGSQRSRPRWRLRI